jgi:hypothetical protein
MGQTKSRINQVSFGKSHLTRAALPFFLMMGSCAVSRRPPISFSRVEVRTQGYTYAPRKYGRVHSRAFFSGRPKPNRPIRNFHIADLSEGAAWRVTHHARVEAPEGS